MKTIILPGYSMSNEEWAKEAKDSLSFKEEDVIIHYWKHWTNDHSTKTNFSPERFDINYEADKIINTFLGENCYIIAKSIGTRVAMKILTKIPNKVEKLILCGIPTKNDQPLRFEDDVIEQSEGLYSKGLKNISADDVICFQNESDPFARYGDIKNFLGAINPNIKVIKKPRNDHHYPYYKDFYDFFSDNQQKTVSNKQETKINKQKARSSKQ